MQKSDSQDAPLAYEDPEFLASDDARPLRIIAEYLSPLRRLRQQRVHDTIVFFGSARLTENGALGKYYNEARELSRLITLWSATLPTNVHHYVICSGGGGGIMEAANRGASDAGGRTIGLNINLPHEQRANPYVTPELLFKFRYFFMRKLWFAYLARAMVVFPGGFGTFDELFELLTLTQTEKLAKRICIVIYGKDYWDRVINFQALVDSGTISPDDLNLFHWANTPEEAFAYLQADLTKHHLEPPGPRDKSVDLTKSRG